MLELVSHLLMLFGVESHEMAILIIKACFPHYKTVIIL